ncbi:hypothetical protein NW752_011027 [Fusarium irregulare]|uniref:Uncharacterized protein n=1 Tax=Fusarium irregulare TaxID=2494466 RepID=A0A9W8U3Y0_9HYPO|nr:hypothetical protein NW766_012053 [Fusarium irregulare]KAJ4005700.1 hypothetical protein NW752_011027 [Fusarium irregulare]
MAIFCFFKGLPESKEKEEAKETDKGHSAWFSFSTISKLTIGVFEAVSEFAGSYLSVLENVG